MRFCNIVGEYYSTNEIVIVGDYKMFSKDYFKEQKEKRLLKKIIKIKNPDPRVNKKVVDDLYEAMKRTRKDKR